MNYEIQSNRMRAEAMRSAGLFNGTRAGIVAGYDPKNYAAKVTIMPEGGDPDAEPGSADTGWLPISTIWSGDGWGIFCPPGVGDQVTVEHVEGDIGSGIITGRVFDSDHIPVEVQSGEFWLVHQSGTSIKLTNDTNAQISVVGNLDIVTGAQPADDKKSPNDSATYSVTATGDMTLVSSNGSVTVADKDGSTVKLDGSGGITVQANGTVTVQANEVDVKADTVSVDASTINLGSGGLHKLVTDALVSIYNGHTHMVAGVMAGPATLPTLPTQAVLGPAALTTITNAG